MQFGYTVERDSAVWRYSLAGRCISAIRLDGTVSTVWLYGLPRRCSSADAADAEEPHQRRLPIPGLFSLAGLGPPQTGSGSEASCRGRVSGATLLTAPAEARPDRMPINARLPGSPGPPATRPPRPPSVRGPLCGRYYFRCPSTRPPVHPSTRPPLRPAG